MTGTEARKLSDEQIRTDAKALREKLFSLRNQATTEKVENTSQFRAIRKDIARLLTEQSSRRATKLGAAGRPAPASKPVASKPAASKKTAPAAKKPAAKKTAAVKSK